MKLKLITPVLLIILLTGFITACDSDEEPPPEPVPVAVSQPNVVSAEAFVVPVRESNLAFETNGRIVTLEVEEGDEVAEGQLMAKLDDAVQQASMQEVLAAKEQTMTELDVRAAALEQTLAGLNEAEANLANVVAGPTEAQIAQLEAALARAEAVLAEAIAGPTPEGIAEAEAQIVVAQAELNKVLAGFRDEEIAQAASGMLQAEADVRLAQADYDENIFGDPARAEPYGIALQTATLTFEQTKAEFDRLTNGATPEEIAVAQAQVSQARTALDSAQAGTRVEQIAQAQADVARAQAEWEELVAGATLEEIAIAQSKVDSAQANINASQANLDAVQAMIGEAEARIASVQAEIDKTELTAPFAGTIGLLNMNEGEFIQAGTQVVEFGDTGQWQIETDDLTEIDVVDVKVGASVTISVDALPGETLSGKVARVTPKAETKAGDETFTILIDITEGDTSSLKWGMTTFVDIEVGPDL